MESLEPVLVLTSQKQNHLSVNLLSMKKGFLIIVIISSSFFSTFAQENPWLPKGETPWGEYEKTEKVEKIEKPTTATETNNQHQPMVDSLKIAEVDIVDTIQKSESELYLEAGMVAQGAYKCKNDFIIGCFFGVVTITGVIPSILCVAGANKQETKLVKEIESRSAYEKLDDKKLHRRIKNNIKKEKFKATIGGALAGLGAKAIIIYMLATS